ncbi:hypothetical protein Zm00014a_019472 [Zea mays]|uniref:Uncharacterized protein n=1 Tax=Zea mays TaxID=4577 RepID=A0A3L6FTG0_MAIZE|nr:hypothetical protein Zm00014a_019472 [Zea mays]
MAREASRRGAGVGKGGRCRRNGSAVLGPGRAPSPTARGVTAGGGHRGPEVAGATATARRRDPAALQTGLPTAAAVVEEAGVADLNLASVAYLAVSAGEPVAGRLGLEEATAAGARAVVGSAAAGGSGHREAADVAATEEGRLASGSIVYTGCGIMA